MMNLIHETADAHCIFDFLEYVWNFVLQPLIPQLQVKLFGYSFRCACFCACACACECVRVRVRKKDGAWEKLRNQDRERGRETVSE